MRRPSITGLWKNRFAPVLVALGVAVGVSSLIATPLLAVDLVHTQNHYDQVSAVRHQETVQTNNEIKSLLRQHSVTFAEQQQEYKDGLEIEEFYAQAIQALCAQTKANCPPPPVFPSLPQP